MARRAFFSFHYDRDIQRAMVVRKSWLTKGDRDAAGYFDASLWEESKKKGQAAVQRLIDEGLERTSVTAVLVGGQTASRDYVKYEIDRSIDRGNGLLGIRIHLIENFEKETDSAGSNPLPQGIPIYGWFKDKGYENLGSWIEAAAKAAGK